MHALNRAYALGAGLLAGGAAMLWLMSPAEPDPRAPWRFDSRFDSRQAAEAAREHEAQRSAQSVYGGGIQPKVPQIVSPALERSAGTRSVYGRGYGDGRWRDEDCEFCPVSDSPWGQPYPGEIGTLGPNARRTPGRY